MSEKKIKLNTIDEAIDDINSQSSQHPPRGNIRA